MKPRSAIASITLGCAVGCLVGCAPSQAPRVGVGDDAVFTAIHLIAAEVSVANEGGGAAVVPHLNNGPFTAAEMKRYFETNPGEYDADKSRMDSMLDGQQSATAIFQAAQTQATVSVAANLAATAAAAGQTPPNTPAVTPPTPPVTPDEIKKAFDSLMSAPVIDSPFDQLDRVADFYAAYIIKNLRVRGDSRVVDQNTLAQQVISILPESEQKGVGTLIEQVKDDSRNGDGAESRLILVVFQTHIDPGNMPDVWAGVRMQITHVDGNAADTPDSLLNAVKIVRLHPTRFYDVDQTTFGQGVTRAFASAGNVSVSTPKAGASVNIGVNGAEDEEERRRYLSRISKVASFADATNHSFGFNFYPSNVRVEKRYMPFGLLLTGQPTTYNTSGYLEPGARDCAAILVVPRSVHSLTIAVHNVWGHINEGSETSADPATGPRSFTVTLPKWNPLEAVASTIGAGPTLQPAGTAKVGARRGPTSQPAATANVAQMTK